MVSVLIFEEHTLVRQALEARLQDVGDIDVISSTGACQKALNKVYAVQPDVILMEIKTADGLQTLKALHAAAPTASIIVLTSYPDSLEEEQALALGARAYLLKTLDTTDLIQQIHSCAPVSPTH